MIISVSGCGFICSTRKPTSPNHVAVLGVAEFVPADLVPNFARLYEVFRRYEVGECRSKLFLGFASDRLAKFPYFRCLRQAFHVREVHWHILFFPFRFKDRVFHSVFDGRCGGFAPPMLLQWVGL